MAELKEYPLRGQGINGVVLAPSRFLDDSKQKRIRLESGEQYMVPSEALEARDDGSFYLRQSLAELAHNGKAELEHPTQEPVAAAPVPVQQPSYESPAVDQALFRHGYSIERVPVDQVLE